MANVLRLFNSSKKVIEEGRAYIELLEDFPCERKEQLRKREGELIRATANCVNIQGKTPRTIEQIKANKKQSASENTINDYIAEIIAAKTKYESSADEAVQDKAYIEHRFYTKCLDRYLTRHCYSAKEKRDITTEDLHLY